jgi:hypothetical protein
MLNSNHRNVSTRLDALPIPPAALVINLHSMPDDVLDTLRIEIENLASEMDMRHVSHWRYLTDFLHLKKLPLLTDAEIEALATSAQQQLQRRTLSGRAQQVLRRYIDDYYIDDDEEPSFLDNLANDELRRNIEESMVEMNAVRNKRHQAVGDLGKNGTVGRNAMDPKVQVIFLTDEGEPETLSSASAYAALLKHEYGILERDGQLVLDTMVICLNHDNRGRPPKRLLSRLRWPHFNSTDKMGDEWQHLDSLVLCEYFGANAVNIPKSMQPSIAELLLYTLLICQPPQVRSSYPDPTQRFLSPPKTKEIRSLPPQTYVVGLSAVEYSARWGRLLLNYDLATEMIEVLLDAPLVDQVKTSQDAETWLSDWRDLVRNAVLDKITGDIPAQQAFGHADAVAKPAEQVFASSHLNLETGDKTARVIEQYTQAVAQTYTMPVEERDAVRKAMQVKERTQQVTLPPTLQDALDSIPQFQQDISSWQDGEQEIPLREALTKARNVLSDQRFFIGAQGSVSRARLQLQQLSKAIAAFRNKHRQEAVNLKERREDLEKMSRERIEDLKIYLGHFPLLAGFLKLKGVLAAITLAFLMVLSIIVWLIAFAWIHHVGLLTLPSLIQTLDQTLSGVSYYTMLVVLVLLLDIIAVYRFFRRRVLSKKRSGLWIEIFFEATLFMLAILGWIVTFSTIALGNDQSSQALRFLLQQMHLPFISMIALILATVIVVTEGIYYLWWFGRLATERVRIVEDIRAHLRETSQAVRRYIADAIALDLLKRAQLTDGNGDEGQYYYRIVGLILKLNEIRNRIGKVSELATQRLAGRVNEKVGAGIAAKKVPTLRIREELLNVRRLLVKDKELRDSLTNNREELKEFAEILLRAMGEETPVGIDQEMRSRPFVVQQFGEQSYQESRERHEAQLLMSTTVAAALRMAVAMPRRDVVAPLEKRCLDLDYRITEECADLKSLLEMMEGRLTAYTHTHHSKGAAVTSSAAVEDETLELAGRGLAIWGQMLWESKDKELHTMLASNGIIHHLRREDYDPQTVKSLLATHTVVTGRSSRIGQLGELYVLMFPSIEGRQYFQEMRMEPHFLYIPDTERIVLLYIGQYVAEPHFIVDDTTPDIQ